MVGEGHDARRLLVLDHEGEVEHVGHREISGVWINHLGRDHRLHEVVIMFAIPLVSRLVRPAGLRVADLRVETSWPYFRVKLRKKIAYSYLKVT